MQITREDGMGLRSGERSEEAVFAGAEAVVALACLRA